jgi:hypothetical protein
MKTLPTDLGFASIPVMLGKVGTMNSILAELKIWNFKKRLMRARSVINVLHISLLLIAKNMY